MASQSFPVIKVVGVGGAGGNAVAAMRARGLGGAELFALNTDGQALTRLGGNVIELGQRATRGLGAGGRAEVGRSAAFESRPHIEHALAGADLVFVTAGMGGGTGTGAAPLVAHVARESGALVVGVVSRPFLFEGRHRRRTADAGLEELEPYVDALLVIENDRLLGGEDLTASEAFDRADEVLGDAVRGIGDLAHERGVVNLDFAHVREVLREGGRAVMGRGVAREAEGGAVVAVRRAIECPLLDDDSIEGARGVLLHLCAGPELPLRAVEQAARLLEAHAHEDAEIVFGVVHDPARAGRVEATVIATDFAPAVVEAALPMPLTRRAPRNAIVML